MTAIARRLWGRKIVRDTVALQLAKFAVTAISTIASLLSWRLLGPSVLGTYALAGSLLILWQTLDLTGVNIATGTRLAMAVGAEDTRAPLDLLAYHIRISAIVAVVLSGTLFIVARPLAAALYAGDAEAGAIGLLAAVLSLRWFPDALYGMAITAMTARREMRAVAGLQIANQAVLSACVVAAAVIQPTAGAQVIGQLVYSLVTMALALMLYERGRSDGPFALPSLAAIVTRAPRVPIRPYWRFGAANAIDKNIAVMSIQLPVQMVGAWGGAAAAGFLNAALSAVSKLHLLTSPLFENLSAVVPQAIGRGDDAALWRGFSRALVIVTAGAALAFGAAAIAAPVLVAAILGEEWRGAAPSLGALMIFGGLTTIGGMFGALYRSLRLVRGVVIVKAIALAAALAFGAIAVRGVADAAWRAAAGAWAINLAFAISVAGTAWLTIPALRRRAKEKDSSPPAPRSTAKSGQ